MQDFLYPIYKRLPFLNKISLTVLFLEYDRPTHGGSDQVFETLKNYLAPITKCRITYLRVDNKNEGKKLKKIDRNTFELGGDNRYREFSGWQKGIEHLHKISSHCDLVLFVNDMFLAPGESFLKDYADINLLEKSLNEKLIIGRIDSTGEHYTAYNYDVSKWVCTNCFLAPKIAITAIGDIVTIKKNIDDFLPTSYSTIAVNHQQNMKLADEIFNVNAPLNDTYKLWLVEWLTKRWHSKFKINANTWDLFRIKVRNILNESLLSARFTEAGFKNTQYGHKIYY